MDHGPEFLAVLSQFELCDAAELRRALVAWHYELSSSDLRLIEFLAQGYTNVQLAEALNLAEPGSAQDRVDRLIKRLSLRDRREVATFAGWCGLGPQPWIDPRTGQLRKTHK